MICVCERGWVRMLRNVSLKMSGKVSHEYYKGHEARAREKVQRVLEATQTKAVRSLINFDSFHLVANIYVRCMYGTGASRHLSCICNT